MLDRIYIDNYRTLVNFDLKLDQMSLLLGENGSGKTSVFDCLRAIQAFLAGDANVLTCFPPENLTRWQSSDLQRFELEGRVGAHTYSYELVIEFDADRRKARVQKELLWSEGKPSFEFVDGMVQLYRDDSSQGPTYPQDPTKSGLSTLYARADNTRLTAFKEEVARMIILKPCPVIISEDSRREEERLDFHGENFVSWYRYLLQSEAGQQGELFTQLGAVLEGFDSFRLTGPAGSTKRMMVKFRAENGTSATTEYGWNELSDGQRMLILLYTLVYGTAMGSWILMIDEPDNYLSLREVQPWMTAVSDLCGKHFGQAVFISHHTEIINLLAGRQGIYMDRDQQGPTRILEGPKWIDGLTPAETVARGWVK